MTEPLLVPPFGESIVEGTIVRWAKNAGSAVKADEVLVEIETDKITVEVSAPSNGVLSKIAKQVGEKVHVGEVLGEIDGQAVSTEKQTEKPAQKQPDKPKTLEVAKPAPAANDSGPATRPILMPAAERLAKESGVDPANLVGSGRGGRVLKEDVSTATARAIAPPKPVALRNVNEREQRVPMSPLRQRIAERLLEAQSQAAILTTFNEADMSQVLELRKRYQDKFVERHGIKLGFMSFFVKAAIEALKLFPSVNAEISGSDIIYKNYYDIGVAVGGGKGLVVPVVRDADQLAFAELEKTIADLSSKAKANKLTVDDMKGGTFTLSNGGIYGSLLSTPILNPPQSGILGMHNIQERAVVVNGQIVVRPMMYLALSYDHRLVDGREAVQFLVRLKECIENPERLMLEV